MILLPILMLGLVPMVNAHSQAYWFGYKNGLLDGKGGVADSSTCGDEYTNSKIDYKDAIINIKISSIVTQDMTMRCFNVSVEILEFLKYAA